jgi:hypothetical protein
MTAQEVAELLWAERQPFTLESVKEFLQKHSLEVEGEVDAFAQTVFEEALERTTRALKALWGVIGYGPYPEASAEIEGSLRNGGRVQAHYSVHPFYNRRVEVKTEGVGPIYLSKNPIVDAIKAGLNQTFERFRNGEENSLSEVSPKMLAFLKAFVDHENPLQALADRKLRPYVVAELFKGIF